MPITAAQREYRKRPDVIERERAWRAEYIKRPEVKARDAERKRAWRATQEGAEANRARVKADRKRYGTHYVKQLIVDSTGLDRSQISNELVEQKRVSLQIKALAREIVKTAKEQS